MFSPADLEHPIYSDLERDLRRDVARRARQHRRRLLLRCAYLLLALAGVALIAIELTATRPSGFLVCVGAAAILPLLSSWRWEL